MTAAVTPVSYPFEPVIAASKQLLYGVRPDGRPSHFEYPASSCRRILLINDSGDDTRYNAKE